MGLLWSKCLNCCLLVRYLIKTGLFTYRHRCVLNARGWLVLAIVIVGTALLVCRAINPFLSVNIPVGSDVLIVESWVPDYALCDAAREFKRGTYRYIIATGVPLDAGPLSEYKTGAEYAAAKLGQLGVQSDCIVSVPSEPRRRDRTYSCAIAVRRWLSYHDPLVHAVDVFTLGVHARRSRFLFQKALGHRFKVGTIAFADISYDPDRWWTSSEGFRTVVSESLAYLYARCVFPFIARSCTEAATPEHGPAIRPDASKPSGLLRDLSGGSAEIVPGPTK
jgi:hypothetical protein